MLIEGIALAYIYKRAVFSFLDKTDTVLIPPPKIALDLSNA
jgi:hypothetical protein